MNVSKLTQAQLKDRWAYLLDDNDFTEIDVDYEVDEGLDIDYKVQKLPECAKCDKWCFCSMVPDECLMPPVSLKEISQW